MTVLADIAGAEMWPQSCLAGHCLAAVQLVGAVVAREASSKYEVMEVCGNGLPTRGGVTTDAGRGRKNMHGLFALGLNIVVASFASGAAGHDIRVAEIRGGDCPAGRDMAVLAGV